MIEVFDKFLDLLILADEVFEYGWRRRNWLAIATKIASLTQETCEFVQSTAALIAVDFMIGNEFESRIGVYSEPAAHTGIGCTVHLADDIILKPGFFSSNSFGQFIPYWSQTFAVSAPWGIEFDEPFSSCLNSY